ncbi:hypothetical protein BJ138DRAFT_1109154 [Hygrophoropsis aurantiaca]|uniref:Uncharacterized protein n=1 Tax=Hygrophoropsis aurantiaca TaxID=72124 RepID=A0ACB8ARS7_9AGAM|nr:hypothetical protein BJ138DRAFT_1109154 [Hygrophoropsis aurantiaca]
MTKLNLFRSSKDEVPLAQVGPSCEDRRSVTLENISTEGHAMLVKAKPSTHPSNNVHTDGHPRSPPTFPVRDETVRLEKRLPQSSSAFFSAFGRGFRRDSKSTLANTSYSTRQTKQDVSSNEAVQHRQRSPVEQSPHSAKGNQCSMLRAERDNTDSASGPRVMSRSTLPQGKYFFKSTNGPPIEDPTEPPAQDKPRVNYLNVDIPHGNMDGRFFDL